jgi:hypothetical protein
MGIRIGDFANERKDLKHETQLGTLSMVYRPNALTPSDEAALLKAREDSPLAMYRGMLEQLCKLLVSWDMEGPLYNSETGEEVVAEGEMVPLDPAVLQHMPSTLMAQLFRAIQEDNVPKSSVPNESRRTRNVSPTNSGNIYQGSFGG